MDQTTLCGQYSKCCIKCTKRDAERPRELLRSQYSEAGLELVVRKMKNMWYSYGHRIMEFTKPPCIDCIDDLTLIE